MPISLGIVVIVVSDTRNGSTDKSGKVLEERILKSGHKLFEKFINKNLEDSYSENLKRLRQTDTLIAIAEKI